jgi:hypothetical protein
MDLLRVQPYSGVDAEFVVPDSFTESTEFNARITDMADLSVTETTYTGEAGDTFTFSFSGLYDNSYRVELWYDGEGIENLLDETYNVVRPYVNPETLGTTATEISTATDNEELARAIIDSVISQGFYYKKTIIETTGLGADYIPLWIDAKKVLQVYENNVLIYDAANASLYPRHFEITKDKTAIVESYTGILNRSQSADLILPSSQSDLLDLNFTYRGFPREFDYRIIVEAGHTSVPSDIEKAAKLLINDISCGKLDYYKRYIADYSTDQFKLKFDAKVFEGTGNLIVDKILSKYAKSITRLGVL